MARLHLSWLAVPIGFTAIPVTVLTVIIYGAVFVSVLLANGVSDVPKNTRGLDLDQAYADLQQITARPHPYHSHENEDVHAYILSRLEPLAAQHTHVHLVDDLTSNASYFLSEHGTYFEGTNILFKIDGTDSPLASPDAKPNGLLLSAHYDSVSTSPGATDNGMGVVTLLALAEYLSAPERRPRRTAVLFWNNGEEDGLNGAFTLWKHPWSNLTSTFINLEGAASGGRPIVFRSTSIGPARSFRSGAIAHPHIDVLATDAWKIGAISSSTDYQIYERGLKGKVEGMSGVDFAFYQNRAFYHTPLDSIVGMGYREARKSLWAMMDSTRGAALSLLNDDETGNEGADGMYFDVLGRIVVLFSVHTLFVTNVIMLVVGPISTLLLFGWVLIASGTFSRSRGDSAPEPHRWAKAKKILAGALGWGRFWIALIIGIAALFALVVGFLNVNPYIAHSRPYLVLTTFMTLAYLALVLPLQLIHLLLPTSARVQKLAISLEHYFLTWLALVFATIATQRWHLGALYWVTLWNICAWGVATMALVESAARAVKEGAEARKIVLDFTPEEHGDDSEQRMVRGILHEAPENGRERDDTLANDEEQGEVVETEPTEITPLMQQHRSGYDVGNGRAGEAAASAEEYGWWIAQLLVAVPLFALLVFKIELLLLLATNNTVCDGSNPISIYASLALFSLLLFVPVTPFAHKLHWSLTLIVAVVFALTLLVSWVAFPFTRDEPFKLFFQQTVELDIPSASHLNYSDSAYAQSGNSVKVLTELTGLSGYLDRLIIPELPSSRGKDVVCSEKGVRPNLMTCRWEGELFPAPGGNNADLFADEALLASAPIVRAADWLDVKTVRLNATRALISLTGTNARACRLYFNKPINSYQIRDDGADADVTEQLAGYEIPKEGATEIRLWSRTWDKQFVVEFGWEATDDAKMEGRASCVWAEYASASAGGTQEATSGRIPALEEVKQFVPLWVLPTKSADGLVEAWTRFSV